MSQMDFMDQLKAYDKDNIKPAVIRKVEKYYKDPRFQPDLVNKQSSAAMCLCMWVRAMVVYDSVAKGIEPKKVALKAAEESLKSTVSELSLKQSGLQRVLNRVAGLVRTLKQTEEKKESLETQADIAKKQLVRIGYCASYKRFHPLSSIFLLSHFISFHFISFNFTLYHIRSVCSLRYLNLCNIQYYLISSNINFASSFPYPIPSFFHYLCSYTHIRCVQVSW